MQKFISKDKKAHHSPILTEETESEWKLFHRVIFFITKRPLSSPSLVSMIGSSELAAAFPNLAMLATFVRVLPVNNSFC